MKDGYAPGHCERVERYAEIVARHYAAFDDNWIFNLRVGAVLHDIGKVAVPGSILCKPAALDEEERAQIQNHSIIGGRIVRMLHGFNLEPIVRHHHERFDGKGYPWRLKGAAIPFESRVILIADTFDAMTSDRPYRRALPAEKAFNELERCSGTQFDPDLVSVALDASSELEATLREMQRQSTRKYFN
jgi:HD-GYP domain-containing protein (c-di-GMP phosphodiesterase class II)